MGCPLWGRTESDTTEATQQQEETQPDGRGRQEDSQLPTKLSFRVGWGSGGMALEGQDLTLFREGKRERNIGQFQGKCLIDGID